MDGWRENAELRQKLARAGGIITGSQRLLRETGSQRLLRETGVPE